ncbi:hypothetical protein Tco_1281236, partial [Tanacetum coccineum]
TNVGVAAPFQQSQIHYHVLILKLQKSFIQLKCNKNVISQKAQVHVKFSNSDNHELPRHQRSSESNQELSSEEIVNQRNIRYKRLLSLMKKRRLKAFKTSRKAHLLEDKQILSVGVFDEHLDEMHVTWAHLEKKQTKLRLYAIYLEELCIQSMETASQTSSDDVRIFKITASWIWQWR